MITFKKLIKHFLLLALICCFNYANAQAGLGVSVDKTGGNDPNPSCPIYNFGVEVGFSGSCDLSILEGCDGDMFLMGLADGIPVFIDPVILTPADDGTCFATACYFNAIFNYSTPDFVGGYDCGDEIEVSFRLVNSNNGAYNLDCLAACDQDGGPSNSGYTIVYCCDSTNGPNDLVGDPTMIIEGDDQRSASSTQNTSFFNNINNTLKLRVISKEAAVIPVQVFSLNGQKVHDQKVAITNGLNEVEISLNHLNDGLYISHTMIDGKAKVIKFAVNK